MRFVVTLFVCLYIFAWTIGGVDAAKRYIGSNTVLVVPSGVTQIELTYLDTDDNVIFKRSLTVKGDQKFVVKAR